MQNIKNIILDYGNVIFHIDFQRTQQAFKNLGIANVDTFFAHKGHDSLFDEFEQGNISADEFRKGIRIKAEKPDLTDSEIDNAWNSLLIGVPDGNHDILLKLKQKYQLFLLSNTNEIHYKWIIDYLKNTHQLDGNGSLFTKDYYSHLLRMRKPNHEIFQHILDSHNLIAQETLFVDDSPQHLKTAKEMGIQTLLMEAPYSLQQLIKKEQLL